MKAQQCYFAACKHVEVSFLKCEHSPWQSVTKGKPVLAAGGLVPSSGGRARSRAVGCWLPLSGVSLPAPCTPEFPRKVGPGFVFRHAGRTWLWCSERVSDLNS